MPTVPADALLAALLETTADAVLAVDADDNIVACSAAAEALLGYSREYVVGLSCRMLCPRDRLADEARLTQQLAEGRPVGPLPGVLLAHDGTRVAVEQAGRPVRDARGVPVGAVRLFRDARQDPDAGWQKRRLQSLIDDSDDAIVTKSLDGIVTSWNPGAERLFGWLAAEVIGRPMTALIPPERQAEEADFLQRISRGEKVDHFETERLRKDGSTALVSVTLSPLRDDWGRIVGVSKIARDIGVLVQAERVVRFHASTDAVTGLGNRRAFSQHLAESLEQAGADAAQAALLVVDLDRFKSVNDLMGHHAGDQLLRLVGRRIRYAVRERDFVARLGGDEFTVVLPVVADAREAMAIASRISAELARSFVVEGRSLTLGASVGVALFPDDGGSEIPLLQHADEAVYESKRAGGGRATRLASGRQQAVQDRARLLADLHHALALGQFRLVYQPIVDFATGQIQRVEALLRWAHPGRGEVSPAVFIPLAEEAGLIHAIGDWVFREATRQLAAWRAASGRELRVSINLAPSQLRAGADYFRAWARHIRALRLPAGAITVEITESMVVDWSDETQALLRRIRRHGAEIAIDDFGTGFSSLSLLSRLDVQYLKIDQSFVRAMTNGPRDLALCEAITTMAHKLGLKVVAEGVETEAQAALLRGMGADLAQGYLYGRPVPPAAIEALLRGSAD